MEAILNVQVPGAKKVGSGKVRELFEFGEPDRLLLVATDRISAFDVVLPSGIPRKGEVLTQISKFWFHFTRDLAPNHFLAIDPPEQLAAVPHLKGRSMVIRKTEPFAFEFVVRGYLAGSAWKEYKNTGTIDGAPAPAGLLEAAELPHPILTCTTKAESGHDEPVTYDHVAQAIGPERFAHIRDAALRLYQAAAAHAKEKGIILADSKLEFGQVDGKILVIDELFTPDSSRFWPVDKFKPGGPQLSFDKQFIRDYLLGLSWSPRAPAPQLPPNIIAKTTEKYLEAARRLADLKL